MRATRHEGIAVIPIRYGLLTAAGLLLVPATGLAATAPKPIDISGSGSKVVVLRIARAQPLVVSAQASGSSNFVVKIVHSGGSELLVNEIGAYVGQSMWPDATSGKVRVVVDAEGAWKLRFTQPVPSNQATRIPRTLKGVGPRVVSIRTLSKVQPTVKASNNGDSNFVVYLVGYGTTSGQALIFNEIGPFHGETVTDDEIPAGGYLLWVDAVGPWTITFAS
jgi:hypothetical protein